MSASLADVRREAVLTGCTAVAMWVTFLAWSPFTDRPGGFLVPLQLLAAVVALIGIGGRVLRWPALGTLAAQGVAVTATAAWLSTGVPWDVGGLMQAVTDGIDLAQQYAAPVPSRPGVDGLDPVLIVAGAICLLLADVLARGVGRAALVGLPILTAYAVPVSILAGGVPGPTFALSALAYLTLLYLQHRSISGGWGRAYGSRNGSASLRNALVVGGAAIALALALPTLVPVLQLGVFDGPGPGDGDIQVENPMVDLRRDLQRGEDIDLISVRTADPDPRYLRISVLARFTDEQWSSGDRDIPRDQVAQGELPIPGVASQALGDTYAYDVRVLPSFRSTWLPTQYPISEIDAGGAANEWRYDVETLDFLAVEDDVDTAGLQYQMVAQDIVKDPERLIDSPSGRGLVSEQYLELPDDLPPIVTDLAQEVTADADSRFEKAVALQTWFRSEFDYSLDVSSGNGSDTLVTFLSEGPDGRVGYCEQFASAMAVMSRALDIPARVSVGFLAPERTGPGTYTFSAWDLHAWPELYFPGTGWVALEPTPAARDGAERPPYTQDLTPDEEPSETAGPTRRPSPTASAAPSARADERRPDMAPEPAPAAAEEGGGSWWLWLLVPTVVLLALALVLAPRLLRRHRSTARWRVEEQEGPEAAWAELRDTALDLGLDWPAGRSTRAVRDWLVEHFGVAQADPLDRPPHGPGLNPAAEEALDRIVDDLERARYAVPGRYPMRELERVRSDTETCVTALVCGAPAAARRQATWMPKSLVRRGRSGDDTDADLLGV